MKKQSEKSLFPASLYWTVLGMLLATGGINVGIIILGLKYHIKSIPFVHIVLLYWMIISGLIVLYIKNRIHKSYEIHLQDISKATQKVSQGNFSISIPTINPPSKYNYLDQMILDLNKMIEDLNGIETLRTDFISNVSHELKTPLSVMQNYATMLQDPDLSEESRIEYAKAVSLNCRRLTTLISNILKLNKLENQQIYPTVQPYDLGEELRECILSFEEAWSAKNLELEVDIPDEIIVNIDSQLLSLVWNNFISNAIKFTPEGGKISIKLEKLADSIQVSVKDSGCGMDEKTKAHVFEKFFQGDTSHATNGNGLGLALAARVADICHGKIRVESQQGKGSIFYYNFQ
ncbi:MAG: HAMP domain-containing histidine kinase [Treponema sp.]|nr:HAMP domain-containing histidine kinase [Treponema sp.]